MPRAIWNDVVIAESDKTEVLEGNHYFPPKTIKQEYFRKNGKTTICPWKGVAHYYDIVVGGEVNKEAAWYYPTPSRAAGNIRGHVAFYDSVRIVDS